MDVKKLSIIHILVWISCCAVAFALSRQIFAPKGMSEWLAMELATEIIMDLALGTSFAALVFFLARLASKSLTIPYPGVWLWYLTAVLCLLNNGLDAIEMLEGTNTFLSPTKVEVVQDDGSFETFSINGPLREETISLIRILSHWLLVPFYWLPVLLGARTKKHRLPRRWITVYLVFATLATLGAFTEVLNIRYDYPDAAAALIWLSACGLLGLVYVMDWRAGLKTQWPHFAAIAIMLPAAVARTEWAMYSMP